MSPLSDAVERRARELASDALSVISGDFAMRGQLLDLHEPDRAMVYRHVADELLLHARQLLNGQKSLPESRPEEPDAG